MERIKIKLSGIHERVENVRRMEVDEGAKVVSELVDDIRDTVADFEVSSRAQTGSANSTAD